MLEERTHELRVAPDLGELFMDFRPQLFSLLQRASGNASTPDVTPYQFVWIEVWRVTRQEVQGQLPVGAGDVVPDDRLPVSGQPINDQMYRFPSFEHQPLEQRHEQFTAEPTFVRCRPEGPFGIDCRCRAHSLSLPRPLNDRRLTTLCPSPAMHRICPKPGFVPEKDVGVFFASLLCNSGTGFVLPALDRFRIGLIGTLQRLLRRQIQPGEHRADRRQAEREAKFPLHQVTNQVACPQAEIKSILYRVLAVKAILNKSSDSRRGALFEESRAQRDEHEADDVGSRCR